ncbi:MAG: hypothetical protein DA405_01880 [Bacteroidetes bacterium]|nr:MAG: hypothetical protein DA405_01880 [Bacteroidota bacterium]
MRLILLSFLFSLQLSAQRFSKTDSTFGGANRPALVFKESGFIVADEDHYSLGVLQVGLFDSIGQKVYHKSYDYANSSDSVIRVNTCFKCLISEGINYYFAQIDFLRADSAFVRFTKFNQNLDTIYTKKYLEFQGTTPYIRDIKFDTDSTFVVSGDLFRPTNRNKYDLWVAKFDTAFNPIWELRLLDTIPSLSGGYYGYDLVLDQYGSCLVSGRATHYDVPSRLNIDHSFAARVDLQTGQLKWFHPFNEDLGSQNIAALDNGDGSYSFARVEVLSFVPSTYNPADAQIRLGRIDTSGKVKYDTTTGPKFPYFRFQDLISTQDGNFYVAGDLYVPPYNFPIAAYKFTPDGDSIWMRSYYHLNDSADWNHIWAFQEAPDSGFLHIGQLFDWDNDIAPVRIQHFYMLKTDQYGCLQKGCQSIGLEEIGPLEAELRVYPNPTTGVLHLESDLEQEITYVLFNSLGQAIRQGSFKASKILNIRDLNQGVYVLQTRSGGRNYHSQKIWLQY